MTDVQIPISPPTAALTVGEVAGLLGCSERHVYRLDTAGLMPPKAKLGHLVRWPRQVILEWINGGCKSVGPSSDK